MGWADKAAATPGTSPKTSDPPWTQLWAPRKEDVTHRLVDGDEFQRLCDQHLESHGTTAGAASSDPPKLQLVVYTDDDDT